MPIKIEDGLFSKHKFSGGEINVKLIDLPVKNIKITAILENSEDVMTLLLLVNAIKSFPQSTIAELVIPYFPYARQDRICNVGEAFSLKVMADLINSLNIPKVTIYDPHSDVTPALINNVNVVPQHQICADLIGKRIVVCPDAGAEKKIMKLEKPYIMATKVRDVKTGNIIKTEVHSKTKPNGHYIIVDDICDGGRTFIELAKTLKHEHGAREVDLYVTHGIFSAGFDVFKGYISTIYYLNSDQKPMKVTI